MIKNKLYCILIIPTILGIGVGFNLYEEEEYIQINPPRNWPKPYYQFHKKGILQSQINLGQVLFYDPILSKDRSISCASCHTQHQAFAHSDHKLSHGIRDLIGKRNAPPIQNMAWSKSFMWDGSVHHLDVLAIAPLTNPLEMDSSMEGIIKKLNHSTLYQNLFRKAYKDSIVTSAKILKSLAQFMLTLNSFNAKYDQVKRKEKNVSFNEAEKKGYQLFKTYCASCHTEPLFTNYQFESNGLTVDSVLNDLGRYHITKDKKDLYLFKVPSLRNIEVSYPYMHDGRYENLAMVLHHYSTLHKKSPYLSKKIKNHLPTFSENDKKHLMAFLKTLTDESFLRNKKYGYPFNIINFNQ